MARGAYCAADAMTDTLESIISEKRTFDEWAELIESNLDSAVERVRNEDGLTYAGGKLKFYFRDSSLKKICIAYELYFIDSVNSWTKVEANSDVYADTFTDACLAELREKKEVAYEVTG